MCWMSGRREQYSVDIMLRKLQFNSKRDLQDLQLVLEGAPSYSLKISGEVTSHVAAKETFDALPPGKTYQDKFVFGLQFGDELVGCIDVIRGFPDDTTAMIGLLLIKEEYQKKGLGKIAYQELETFIRTWPTTRAIRIGVVRTNEIVLPFWKSIGFVETGLRKPYSNGTIVSETIVLEKLFSKA